MTTLAEDIAAHRAKRANGSTVTATSTRFRPYTDLGNAECLIDAHGQDLRCVSGLGWYAWDGVKWAPDETGEVFRRAKQTARQRYAEASKIVDDGNRKKCAEWARKSEGAARIAAAVQLASTELAVVCRVADLDADPMLLNVTNGTIDLRTGKLRPHRREDLITKVAGTSYDSAAACPIFDAFLRQIFAGDDELIAFVQRFMGYALAADVREQVLLFCHGGGANGKSTFIDLMIDMMGGFGGYAMPAAPGLLVAKKGDQHPTELADLRGARLVTCVEIGDGKRFDEERVKSLTGGDAIKARHMREDFFTFKPTHRLIVAANHKPQVRGTDHAIWRRILLVPFTVTFTDAQKDRDLPTKLRAELPGILAWAVRGCLEWQRAGLRPPKSVTEATDRYRAEQDAIGRFIADRCTVSPHAKSTAGSLYADFKDWARETGEHELPQRRFGESLAERGYEQKRGQGGTRWWHGLSLAAPDDERGHR